MEPSRFIKVGVWVVNLALVTAICYTEEDDAKGVHARATISLSGDDEPLNLYDEEAVRFMAAVEKIGVYAA